MPDTTFNAYTQTRTTIAAPDAWNAVVLPIGSRNALLMLEDVTAVMRVSSVNTVLAASQGSVVGAGGNYQFSGTVVRNLTLYVAADKATVAVLQFTRGGV